MKTPQEFAQTLYNGFATKALEDYTELYQAYQNLVAKQEQADSIMSRFFKNNQIKTMASQELIVGILRQSSKLNAIAYCRSITNWSLRECKEFVEFVKRYA